MYITKYNYLIYDLSSEYAIGYAHITDSVKKCNVLKKRPYSRGSKAEYEPLYKPDKEDEWFDEVYPIDMNNSDGSYMPLSGKDVKYFIVYNNTTDGKRLQGLFNVNNGLVVDVECDEISYKSKGIFILRRFIEKEDTYEFNIYKDKKGLVFKEWFDYIGTMFIARVNHTTYACQYFMMVVKGGKFNMITKDCKIVFDKPMSEWADCDFRLSEMNDCTVKKNGLYRVGQYYCIRCDKKYNMISRKGKLVLDVPFKDWKPYEFIDEYNDFISVGVRDVKTGIYKHNLVLKSNLNRPLFNRGVKEWFDYVENHRTEYGEDYFKVRVNHKWNIIWGNGKLLYWDKNITNWFDSIGNFTKGYAIVERNHKWNIMDDDGTIIYKPKSPDKWFKSIIDDMKCGLIKVELSDTDGYVGWLDIWGNVHTIGEMWGLYKSGKYDKKNILSWEDKRFVNGLKKVVPFEDFPYLYYVDKNYNLYDENKNPIEEVRNRWLESYIGYIDEGVMCTDIYYKINENSNMKKHNTR